MSSFPLGIGERARRLVAWVKTLRPNRTPASPAQDHALVLSVKPRAVFPSWIQWRLLRRVLSVRELRILGLVILIGAVGLLSGIGLLIRPHLMSAPAAGGTVSEALIGAPKFINPLFASSNDVDRDLSALIFSGLFRLDEKLEPQPDLAEQYQWLEPGKKLQVSLRKDIRFHDGQPLTAEDIVFTYQAIKQPEYHSPLAGTYRHISVSRVDDETVIFETDQVDPYLLYELTLGILPGHLWEDIPPSGAQLAEANVRPIGSGPYRAVAFTRDAKGRILTYHLQRYDRFYGLRPNVQDWQFRFYADREQALTALRSNQVDALAFLPWGEVDKLNHPTLNSIGLELPQETVAFFNTKDALLQDERIRRALDLAVDRHELQDLVGAHTQVVSGPFPFAAATSTPVDLDNARALLERAGWKLKEGESVRVFVEPRPAKATGKKAKTVEPPPVPQQLALTIHVPQQTDLLKVAELLKRRWSLLGIKVEIQSAQPEDLLRSALQDRNYQVLIWNVLLPPTQDLSPFWLSGNASGHGLNLSNLNDREVDQALGRIASALTAQDMTAAREVFSRTLQAKTPAIFLLRPSYAYLINERVRGITAQRIGRPADRLLQASAWYVNTSWQWK